MQNYHNHSSYSNLYAAFKDSHVSYEDYAKRAVELGQKVITSVEHGFQGNYLRCWQTAKKYGLKFIYGVEAYFVRNWHDMEEDAPQDTCNAHMVVLARNLDGIHEINEMLSTANESGYYRAPRIDMTLLKKLTPENVFITTACVAYWGKVNKEDGSVLWHYGGEENTPDEMESITKELHEHFGSSMMLEVQNHNTLWQKQVNQKVMQLHYSTHMPIICGLDSHYIYPEQKEERKWLREESGVRFNDEDHEFSDEVYEDYPDEQTTIDRFNRQGILNASEIREAIDNTDTLLSFEDVEFNMERKLPTIYPELTQEERNQKYLDRVWSAWNQNKKAYLDNAKYLYDEYIKIGMDPKELNEPTEEAYEEAIRYETGIVTDTNTSDYFLLDSELVRLGVEKGGFMTPTGRGSASSFFTNTLLGLSTIDRLSLPVKLYPDRFVTKERLLTSLPDIDLNLSVQQPFADAQEELLGKGHSYPMCAFGTLKLKSAFKLFARSQNIPADVANEVSKQIDEYERAMKEADDDEKDNIDITDFVDNEYAPYITGSEPYRGIVVSKSQAPCAFLIYNGDIRSEIGIMRINADGGKKVVYCTVIDGYTADEFGYVKNDLLVVNVIGINAEVMKRAGCPQYTSQEIIRMTMHDQATWDIFSKGYTQGINQCQGIGTTGKIMRYKPRELRDLSAFVAAIRPGFKSQLNAFLAREPFRYDVDGFDSILHNDSSGSSWMLYQENSMSALGLAGFDMARTYPIIKAISKKKTKVIAAAEGEFKEGFVKYLMQDKSIDEDTAASQAGIVWNVIHDSASYSFNSSHAVCVSLDALYGAYLKAHHPLEYYSVLLENYSDNVKKVSLIKAEMKNAFGITVAACRFRQDNRSFFIDRENNQIVDALSSVKYVSRTVANELYKRRNTRYDWFVELIHDLSNNRAFNSRTIKVLIRMGYFSEFGSPVKLLNLYDEYAEGKNKVYKTLKESTIEKRMDALREIEFLADEGDLPINEQMRFELEHYGTPLTTDPKAKKKFVVLEVNASYTPKIRLYSIATGNVDTVKIKKDQFKHLPVEVGDIMEIKMHSKRNAFRFVNGKAQKLPDVFEIWANVYDVEKTNTEE